MANYSFFVLGESSISLTGGVTLDGITQGDGSHLVGEFLTINNKDFTEVLVRDDGSDTNFADNDDDQRLRGSQTIDGVTYSNNTTIEAEYEITVIDDNTGIEYTILAVNINNSSPSYATVEALAFVDVVPPTGASLRIIGASEGPSNSGGGAVDEAEIVPICFCAGALIETARGPVPVEVLVPGDDLLRPDGTAAALRQVFRTTLDRNALAGNAKLRPVRITAGSLGAGRPARDLLVSRQHRMLVASPIANRMFGDAEVLVSAIRLTALPGIYVDDGLAQVTYFHLLLEDHEIILAEGAPTESLFTGPEALKSVNAEARQEILALFPDISKRTYQPKPARLIPTGAAQKKLVARHARNGKSLLA